MDQGQTIILMDGPDNRITQAVVYDGEALVTRRAVCSVAAGIQRISMEVLAERLTPDACRARVIGRGEILGVQYSRRRLDEAPRQNLREAQLEVDNLVHAKRMLESRQRNLQRQLGLLDAVADFSRIQIPRELKTQMPPLEGLQELLGYLDSNGSRLGDEEQELVRRLEQNQRELERARERIKQLRGHTSPRHAFIDLLFHASEPGQIEAEVYYLAQGAAWQPRYRLEVPDDRSQVILAQDAEIQQQTGEDWNEIQLTLSDASPGLQGRLPEPKRWLLMEQQQVRQVVRMAAEDAPVASAPAMAGGFEADFDLDDSLEELDSRAEEAIAQRAVRSTGFEYRLPQPISLASDDQEQLLPLDRKPLQGSFHHYCVPASDPQAALVFATEASADWLPGTVNVLFDGRLVSRSRLGETPPGEELRFHLGIDRGVRVQRECLEERRSETFFGKVDRQQHERNLHWRIRCENRRAEPVELWLWESIPVAPSDRYQVKVSELSPKPTASDWQGREGVMLWRLELPADGIRAIDLQYSLRYPRDNPPINI